MFNNGIVSLAQETSLFGSMKLSEVLEPAISITNKGYPLVPNIVNTIKSNEIDDMEFIKYIKIN